MLSKSSTIFVKRTQFPIMLAWVCIIHNAQGLTLPNLAISLQLGVEQFYVAVRRVIALSKVLLIGDLMSNMTNEYENVTV